MTDVSRRLTRAFDDAHLASVLGEQADWEARVFSPEPSPDDPPIVAASNPRAMTTAEAAALLQLSPEFVREHAAEMGGSKISGPRSAWRFERRRLHRWLEDRRPAKPAEPRPRRRPGPPRKRSQLLPLPERD